LTFDNVGLSACQCFKKIVFNQCHKNKRKMDIISEMTVHSSSSK
jgi:hypothetical protein